MRTIFMTFALISICVLNATNVWIHDAGNPANNQGDWTAPHWIYVYNGGEEIFPSPYYIINYSHLDFLNQGANSDFHYADGWRLIQVHLGNSTLSLNVSSHPYVILYNERTGILRYFFRFHTSHNYSDAIAQLALLGNTGQLASIHTGKGSGLALDKRNEFEVNPVMKYISPYMNYWKFADFYIAYDPEIPLPSSRLHFSAAAVQSYNMEGFFQSLITTEHTSVNTQSHNTPQNLFSIGRTISNYIGLGNNFGKQIKDLANGIKSSSRTGFAGYINTGLSAISTATSGLPYIMLLAGVIDTFSGNPSGFNTTTISVNFTTEITASYSGTITLHHSINSFNMALPSQHYNNANIQSMYNETLGIINVVTSPTVEKLVSKPYSHLPATNQYRLLSLPIEWQINPLSGLPDQPSDLQVSFSFSIETKEPASNKTFRDFLDIGSLSGYVVHYNTTFDQNNHPVFHCYTFYLDYPTAHHMLVSAYPRDLTNFTVRLKSIWEYDDTTKEPFIYITNLKPNIVPVTNTNPWSGIAAQKIIHFTTNAGIGVNSYANSQGILNLQWNYIIDHGADILMYDVDVVPTAITGWANHTYGFEVRDGNLIIYGGSFNVPRGYLRAIGENSSITFLNFDVENLNIPLIELVDGAQLIINGVSVNMTPTNLLVRNGSGIQLNNGGILNINGGNVIISNNSTMFINGSTVNFDSSTIDLEGHSEILLDNFSSMYANNNTKIYGNTLSNAHQVMPSLARHGDRIVVRNNSRIETSFNTEISSRTDAIWEGIRFNDTKTDPPSILRGEIDKVRSIIIHDSDVIMDHFTMTNFHKLDVLNFSWLHMVSSHYINPQNGIVVDHNSSINMKDSHISGAVTAALILLNNRNPSYITNSSIVNNNHSALVVTNTMVEISGSNLSNNGEHGFFYTGILSPIVKNGTVLSNNLGSQIKARENNFPLFLFDHTLGKPSVKFESQNMTANTYLLSVIPRDTYPIDEPVDAVNLNVSLTSQVSFSPCSLCFKFEQQLINSHTAAFQDAVQFIFDNDYNEASKILAGFVSSKNNPIYKNKSIPLLSVVILELEESVDTLLEFLDIINDSSVDEVVQETKGMALMLDSRYYEAVYVFEDIITSMPDTINALVAEANIAYCLLQISESGSRNFPSVEHHVPANYEEYFSITLDLLDKIHNFQNKDNDKSDLMPIPEVTSLLANYPNPFNPSTTISFDITTEDNVRIDIFNIRGQRVRTIVNEIYKAGSYKVEWYGTDDNGRNVASGIYFYQMQTGNFSQTRRMLLLK